MELEIGLKVPRVFSRSHSERRICLSKNVYCALSFTLQANDLTFSEVLLYVHRISAKEASKAGIKVNVGDITQPQLSDIILLQSSLVELEITVYTRASSI